jgi:hypothetical protein
MNTDNTDKHKVGTLDALAALAAKEKSEAANSAASSGGLEPPGGADPFSRLAAAASAEPELIPDEEPEAPGAQDFMRTMAQESEVVSPELNSLRAMTGGVDGVAAYDGSEGSPGNGGFVGTRAPTFSAPQRSAKLRANTRVMHRHAFKQTMIPLLLVVGGVLILLSIITMLMLAGDSLDDNAIAAEGSYMRTYGKFFIIASLPIGAILIMGAWMFFLDTRKSGGGRK